MTLGVLLLGMGLNSLMAKVEVLAETSQNNPLLPKGNRDLTTLEKNRVEEAISQLQTEAQAALEAGDENQAFTLWYQELELQKALGIASEIEALGRIGGIAWEKNRTLDVNILVDRLNLIQQQAQKSPPMAPNLLQPLATAYQQLRELEKAAVIYQQILQLAIKREDQVAQEETLKILGQLYIDRFDYTNAAAIYEQLLKRAEAQDDYFNQGLYLRQLGELYSQALQPENAVMAKQKLAETYLKNQELQKIPALKIEIGDDYQAIDNPESASQNYQEAFSLGWSLKQLATAGEALSKLANLYSVHDQKDYALQVYKELIKVEQQAYDFYGLMTVYDRMGQIYAEQKNYTEALKAFQNGLQLARSLSYQESYFIGQIDQIKKQLTLPR
jgi:tetratricopeptide (TPR) repeat protein